MDKHGPPQGMQPPPPGFAPPPPYTEGQPMAPPHIAHQHQPQVVVVTRAAANFGPESTPMTCPHCQASISTRVTADANTKTHLFALLLCIVGLWCCVPCPYCMDGCLVKKHFCPACNTYLGQYDN